MANNLLPNYYATGLASVENGSVTVTPASALWIGNAWESDQFFLPSQPLVPAQRIETVNPDGTLTLAYPWPGTTESDVPYEIRYVGIIERSTAQSRRVLEQLGDVKAWFDVSVADDAARLALDTEANPLRAGYRVLVIADNVIWVKATGAYDDWSGPVEFRGDTGNKGWSPLYALVEDGDRVVFQLASWAGGEGDPPVGDIGKYLGATGFVEDIEDAVDIRGFGFNPRGSYSGGTTYAKGDVVLNNGSSWVALQATTGNAPPTLPTTSNAYWQLFARQGIDGAGTVSSVVGGTGIVVDNTDPTAPVVSIAGGSGEPVGRICMRFGPLDPGFIAWGEGGTFNRTTYPLLAAWLDANGAYLGLSGPEIASGTIPDWRDYSPRTAGGSLGPAVGAKQGDAMQGHRHPYARSPAGASGAAVWTVNELGGGTGNYSTGDPVTDGTNGTPRTASETRVKAFGVRWQIKAQNV